MYTQTNHYNYDSLYKQNQNESNITSKIKNPEDLEKLPIIEIVNDIIFTAIKDNASDIHIEPDDEKVNIRYRIDGMLYVNRKIEKSLFLPLISRIKLMGQMDIAERRLPQDGRAQIQIENNKVDLRISTLPTIFGEKILIRLLDNKKSLLHLDKLGFSKKELAKFENIINYPYGLVLICGPTGSGKTTTLYAALNQIASTHKNIITIEDPVEYVLKGINQVQCNEKSGLNFSKGLKSIVRQDPDVIMIGEIRDQETAQISVSSSNTGHLVLSTLHTNNSTSALNRLVDMGVEPFLVASSVMAVVSQRLVRKTCLYCAKRYQPEQSSPEVALLASDYLNKQIHLTRAIGCSKCSYTGYKGRIPIQEIFTISADERKLLLNGADSETIKKSALKNNLVTMKKDGIDKALAGITTISEIIRVTASDEI